MNSEQRETIVFRLMISGLIIIAILTMAVWAREAHATQARLDMWTYADNVQDTTGVYSNNKEFYCVTTYGRTQEQIAATEEHEICHSLVRDDYHHFCEE